MFQEENMSPRVLNKDRLEKKFASLTKSRESILGLSTWIINHKAFYREIVEQWLDALCKDMNALTMFYVANDVIQNCGRKKAPEFREAFGTVLEKAVSLEKVKEIKAEVIRMLTLWHERSIYDAVFYKKLQDKLNDVEESESDEEEQTVDVISNFKLENLTVSLRKMRTLEEELLIKEEFLEDIEEPGIANIDNLIVKMDSQKELRKVDKFQKLVENYLSLADRVMAAQKEALLNLKNSGIFYNAQLEDAKKVAHAYRIYGKKVKIVKKALIEKVATLPEASSPVLEENSSDIEMSSHLECQSPGLSVISDKNNENSNLSSNIDPNSNMNENCSFINTDIVNEIYKSPLSESLHSLSTLAKDVSTESKETKIPTIIDLTKNIEEEEKILKSHVIIETTNTSINEKNMKSPLIDNVLMKDDKMLKSPLIDNVSKKNAKMLKSPLMDNASKKCDKILKSPLSDNKLIKNDKTLKNPLSDNKLIKNDKTLKSPLIDNSSKKDDKILKSPFMDNATKISDKVQKTPIIIEDINNQIEIDTSDTSNSLNNEKILKSHLNAEKNKPKTDQKFKSAVTVEKSNLSTDQKTKSSSTGEKIRLSTNQKSKNLATGDIVKRTNNDKISKCVSSASSENTTGKDTIKEGIGDSLNNSLEEKKLKSLTPGNENSGNTSCSLVNETPSASKELKETSENVQTLSDIENIDFLLEKSYNEQRTKSKASFKRKIDNLLKLKQSKACKFSNDNTFQEDKIVSETAEDSTVVSCGNLDRGKKVDVPEPLIIKEESIMLTENVKDTEKVSSASNFEQSDKVKTDQSLEITQNSKTIDFGNTSETVSLSSPAPFSNFPDIPTELLKNILDKHRTNMIQSSTDDSCSFTTQLPSHKAENTKLSDSNQNSMNCSNIENDKKNVSPALVSSLLDHKSNDITGNMQSRTLQDKISNININKNDSKQDSETVLKNFPMKTTPLMENLQKLLKCFTEKGTAFNNLKNSNTLKTLPNMSLRSTLKLYHVLKLHHKNDNSLDSLNVNDNSAPDLPTEIASTVNNNSSVSSHTSTGTFAHSKNDNLEIMDMDVDSDD